MDPGKRVYLEQSLDHKRQSLTSIRRCSRYGLMVFLLRRSTWELLITVEVLQFRINLVSRLGVLTLGEMREGHARIRMGCSACEKFSKSSRKSSSPRISWLISWLWKYPGMINGLDMIMMLRLLWKTTGQIEIVLVEQLRGVWTSILVLEGVFLNLERQ